MFFFSFVTSSLFAEAYIFVVISMYVRVKVLNKKTYGSVENTGKGTCQRLVMA